MLTDAPAALEDLPPSCKLVYAILREAAGPLEQGELTVRTALSGGTVSQALDRLEAHALVERRQSLRDARKRLIELRDTPENEP